MDFNYGHRLKMIRKDLQLSPEDTAAVLGVPVSIYKRYEAELSSLSPEVSIRLISAGYNLDWLYTGTGPMHRSANKQQDLIDSYAREISLTEDLTLLTLDETSVVN